MRLSITIEIHQPQRARRNSPIEAGTMIPAMTTKLTAIAESTPWKRVSLDAAKRFETRSP